MKTYQDNQNTLEAMIDSVGLSTVLEMLETICIEKAEHLRSNWQDEHSAKQWQKASGYILAAEGKIIELF